MRLRGKTQAGRALVALFSAAIIGTGAVTGASANGVADTLGKTTVQQKLAGDGDEDFQYLSATGPGEPYVVREGPGGDGEDKIGVAQAGRENRRTSLFYLGQLSDFQLADEESPARVEFLDVGPFSSAHRQNEAFLAHQADAMVRQINAFAPASPLTAGDGSQRAMDLTLNTGDIADSQQKNEAEWVRTIAEGGTLTPGSGTDPATSGDPLCIGADLLGLIPDADSPANYTGQQDYDDYAEGVGQYYDPDQPTGAFSEWPSYPGLMDATQTSFEAAGLDVPHYAAFGNHDALAQGNAAANAAYESVATGCVKPMIPGNLDSDAFQDALADIAGLDLTALLGILMSDPQNLILVPPDENRQFVSKQQWKQIWKDGSQPDGHGFGHVDAIQEAVSNGSAGYYSWEPEPGIRFISVDTVSEAGVIGPSADGNVDHPQYLWLQSELEAAEAADELVVLFSHHAIPSLNADVADELAGPCTANDSHGHDVNPGCDPDPRNSEPIHLGADMEALVHQYPNVIAWVAGHSHQNDVDAYPNPDGEGGFWSIRTAAEADWPMQSRLIEIFDNEDGTLSIFGTILDLAAPSGAVGPGTNAAGLTADELASLGRTIGFNETQYGAASCNPTCEGQPTDRNVELLVEDPREGDDPDPPGAERCTVKITGTKGPDNLVGTEASERIIGRAGKDRIKGRGGRDCLRGGAGRDKVRGGDGNDRLAGGKSSDRLVGNAGRDRLSGGRGNDRLKAMDGERDIVRCGSGRNDRAKVDFDDVVKGCERVVSGGP